MSHPVRAGLGDRNVGRYPVWLVVSLVWLLGFFAWFQTFGFPNNPALQRSMVWGGIPFELLDLVDPPLEPGAAPWSWWNLLQRGPYLLAAILIWGGAWGLGSLALRWMKLPLRGAEQLYFACSLGLSLLSLVTLLLGLAGGLSQGPFGALLLISIGIAVVVHRRFSVTTDAAASEASARKRETGAAGVCWTCRIVVLLLIPFVFVQLLGAMTPQTDFDVVEYHLGGPKEWFLQGGISRLPHNIYTNFPFLTEMLILDGMVVCGDWRWGALAGQAVLAGFAPLTALGLYAAGRRWFSSQAGCIAALVYLTSPWTYRISIIAYAEGGLACYLFAALFAGLRVGEEWAAAGNDRKSVPRGLLLLCGALAGSAMACKYTGLTSVVIPVSLLMLWIFLSRPGIPSSQGGRHFPQAVLALMLFGAGVAVTVGPWLLKNAVATGNPVYPLAYRVFGGKDRDEELDLKWRQGHAAKTYASWGERLSDLPVKLSDVMANNDWHSPLMFGLAPLSIWWLRRRRDRAPVDAANPRQGSDIVIALWLYVAWQFATWWLLTHHIDRFYVPMFSVVALLAGIGMTWPVLAGEHAKKGAWSFVWPLVSTGVVVASILYNVQIMLYVGGFNAGRRDLRGAELIAIAPRIQWLNEMYESGQLPAKTKVLCVGEAALFHARFPYVYNTVFDRSVFEEICKAPGDTNGSLRPIEEIRSEFHRRGITHIDVNWAEIQRYRAPGSYGYSEFIQPELFAELQKQGLLGPNLFKTGRAEEENSAQVFVVLPE
ncbi:hypothetical protein [Schlesneria sp.]|uniref:hypothetical protein n=1 Tax=Schlesneria sp. TaxID=2762018 RepID=UPI002EEFFEF3